MQVSLVPVGMVDQVWPGVVQGFARASDRSGGDMTVGDLWTVCRSGNAHLFVVHDPEKISAATVWRAELWRSGQKFRCLALYGKGMAEWMPELKRQVARVAADCGCTSLLAEGREGWTKIFPNAKRLRTLYEEPI